MKKIKIFTLVLGAVIGGSLAANAQKIGFVNVDALVYNLPEAQKTQETLQKWQVDSVGGEYTRLMKEYQEKDSTLKKTTAPSVKQLLEKDMKDLEYTLANWQQIAGQYSQAKQAELFGPLYDKVMKAINTYAKEKGYNYVLTQEAAVVAPDADNLSLPVAQRLGIKINQGQQQQPAHTAPAAAPKTPVKK